MMNVQTRPEISQSEIDLKTVKSLSGESRACMLYRLCVRITAHVIVRWSGMGGMAPEAPHVYKNNNKYYLIIAEGHSNDSYSCASFG
jgi:hypothetical protein